MPARNPEELDQLFAEALNRGDLDALAALYEPHAALTTEPGHVATGSVSIREALDGYVAAKPRLTLSTKLVAETGDLALITSNWESSSTGADGEQVKRSGQSAEVCRRQPNGDWLFVIDSPWGIAQAG
jgi:uncharacterized protein (TIGR02246 family)